VYVAPGADAETITVFKADGTFVRQFGQGSHIGATVGGITVDGAGNVYVTSRADPTNGINDDVVVRFSPQGDVTGRWAPLPGHPGAGDSALSGIAVAADGSMYVLTHESNNTLVHLDAQGHRVSGPNLSGILDEPLPRTSDIVLADGLLYISGSLQLSFNPPSEDGLAVISLGGRLMDVTKASEVSGSPAVAVDGDRVYISGFQKSPAARAEGRAARSHSRAAQQSGQGSLCTDCSIGDLTKTPVYLPNPGSDQAIPGTTYGGAACDASGWQTIGSVAFVNQPPAGCSLQFNNIGSPCPPDSRGSPVQGYLGGQKVGELNGGPRGANYTILDIPPNEVGKGDVVVQYSCRDLGSGEITSRYEEKGNVQGKTDPSGTVVDARTLKPIAGAMVSLAFSPAKGAPFAVPGIDALSPQLLVERTFPSGVFSWDVIAGLWKIKVSAFGYRPFTSKAYTVPPPVTGIVLKLRADTSQQRFLIDTSGGVGSVRLGASSGGAYPAGLRIRAVGGHIRSITVLSGSYRTSYAVRLRSREYDLLRAYPALTRRLLTIAKPNKTVRFKVGRTTFTVTRQVVVGIKVGK
jgi:hypothetical protein